MKPSSGLEISSRFTFEHRYPWEPGQVASSLEAQLHYLAPLSIYDDVKPYSLLVPRPPGQPRTNSQTHAYDGIAITDLRSCETELNLDTAGFEYIKHRSSCDFSLKESVENQYLQESSELLKKRLGAESIYVFDYTVRTHGNVQIVNLIYCIGPKGSRWFPHRQKWRPI